MKKQLILTCTAVIASTCIGFVIGRATPADLPRTTTALGSRSSYVAHTPISSAAEPPVTQKPLIGIASLTGDSYVQAIRDCGGIPVVLPDANGNLDMVASYVGMLDGLLMPGGPDIPPGEWNEQPHPTTKLLDDDRYTFEKALISTWINETNKPLLGICLGSQWVNVAHGGSLIQDIPSEFGVNHRDVTHKISLDPESQLSRILETTELTVNSFHHQAVRNVGHGLRAVAHSEDGIVEATESTNPERFLIGVQWHPEKLIGDDAVQRKLIRAFINASLKGKK